MRLTRGSQKLRERRYRYDPDGNLTRIDEPRRGATRYTYDPLGQLLSAVQPDLNERFEFDPAGNLMDQSEEEKARIEKTTPDQEPPQAQPSGPAYVRHNRLLR